LAREVQGEMVSAWGMGLLGWLVPGVGHIGQGLVWRGVLGGLTVWLLFGLGVGLGGHFYNLFERGEGLLSNVFAFCNLGGGLIYLASTWLGVAVVDQARLETAEYGNIFLMVAGLINYLLALDAFDLKVGRKH
jgi:hypothetical protein